MTGPASIHQCVVGRLCALGGDAVVGLFPSGLPIAVQLDCQALVAIRNWRLRLFSPLDMLGSRAVAGFASDINLVERRVIAVCCGIVAFF